MLLEEIRELAAKIGQFYLQKNNGDYVATEKEITNTRISKIEITKKGVEITTARPGILIGRRGENIFALEKFLQMKLRIIEEEDPLESWLIPYKDEPSMI